MAFLSLRHRRPLVYCSKQWGARRDGSYTDKWQAILFEHHCRLMCLISFPDVIWVILCVDEGGLLGLTQQLSSLGREMNTHQISNPSSPSANPFQLSSTPIGTSPQPIYSVPHNSPANGASDIVHVSPARRSLFNSMVSLSRDYCHLCFISKLLMQGSYRSWETWKVMGFKNFVFKAWKVMEFNFWSLKVMEN